MSLPATPDVGAGQLGMSGGEGINVTVYPFVACRF